MTAACIRTYIRDGNISVIYQSNGIVLLLAAVPGERHQEELGDESQLEWKQPGQPETAKHLKTEVNSGR